MTDSKPPSAFADQRVSRRRLLAIGAAVPAAIVAVNALPGRSSTSAPPQSLPATSPVGATSALDASPAPAGPAHWFC